MPKRTEIKLNGIVSCHGFTGEIVASGTHGLWENKSFAEILDIKDMPEKNGAIAEIILTLDGDKAQEARNYWSFRTKYNL